MAAGAVEEVQLRRYDTSQPWGFRMQGGSEYGMPLYIAQVSPKSIAGKAGCRNGDAILQICGAPCQGWSHTQAKQALIRAGNEVDLVVQRGVVNTQSMPQTNPEEQRVQLDDSSIDPGMNEGSKYRNVMPKSYRILEAQLGGGGSAPAPSALGRGKAAPAPPRPAAQAQGPAPTSIFDRKKEDRSDYLQAAGPTIQKAYGQKY